MATLNEVIKGMGVPPTGEQARLTLNDLISKTEDIRSSARYKSEVDRKIAEAQKVREELPKYFEKVTSSTQYNALLRVVGGLYGEITAAGAEIQVRNAAFDDAIDVAVDKVKEIGNDLANNVKGIGDIVTFANKYLLYIAAVVALVIFFPQIKMLISRLKG